MLRSICEYETPACGCHFTRIFCLLYTYAEHGMRLMQMRPAMQEAIGRADTARMLYWSGLYTTIGLKNLPVPACAPQQEQAQELG